MTAQEAAQVLREFIAPLPQKYYCEPLLSRCDEALLAGADALEREAATEKELPNGR